MYMFPIHIVRVHYPWDKHKQSLVKQGLLEKLLWCPICILTSLSACYMYMYILTSVYCLLHVHVYTYWPYTACYMYMYIRTDRILPATCTCMYWPAYLPATCTCIYVHVHVSCIHSGLCVFTAIRSQGSCGSMIYSCTCNSCIMVFTAWGQYYSMHCKNHETADLYR